MLVPKLRPRQIVVLDNYKCIRTQLCERKLKASRPGRYRFKAVPFCPRHGWSKKGGRCYAGAGRRSSVRFAQDGDDCCLGSRCCFSRYDLYWLLHEYGGRNLVREGLTAHPKTGLGRHLGQRLGLYRLKGRCPSQNQTPTPARAPHPYHRLHPAASPAARRKL